MAYPFVSARQTRGAMRAPASGALSAMVSSAINTFRKNAQTSPSVGVDDEGNALVAWMSRLQKSGGGWGIYGQAFDAAGEAIGKEFEIADFTNPRRQGEPHVCFRPNGRPLISVTNTAGDPSGIAMYGYDRQGNRRESPVFLRPDEDYQLGASRCAISPNGRLGCVVWQVKSPGEDQWDVLANLFSDRGLLNKRPFFVNQTKAGDQVNPGVAFAANNTVLFTWEGAGAGDDSGVFARYFEKDGTALTDELLINDASEGFQGAVDLAVSADRHLVTWVSRGPDAGIFIRDIAPSQSQAPADE